MVNNEKDSNRDEVSTNIRLSEIEKEINNPQEMSEKDLAKMTYIILGGLGFILTLSGMAYIFTDNGANQAAQKVFEFCKNFIPPIVTLVLGAHYGSRKKE